MWLIIKFIILVSAPTPQRSRLKTLERSGLSVAVYGGSILVDETRIAEWGLEASNGGWR